MDVTMAVLADGANTTTEGKVNILGTFDRIRVPELPIVLPSLFVVSTLQAEPENADKEYELVVRLVDSAGVERYRFDALGRWPAPFPGQVSLTCNQLLGVGGVVFDRDGVHWFVFEVDGKELARRPLYVERLQEAAHA